MRVFISWSKEPSRSIASALANWLPSVVQRVDTWMSDEEIRSGDRWSDSIARALDEIDFGIVCVTRANQGEPLLIFEAGAVAKRLEMARVVPLCIDLDHAELTGPLAAFQGRVLNKEGVERIVKDVSDASEKPMPPDRVKKIFEAMWPDLEAEVEAATEKEPTPGAPHRPANEMLAELVDRVRRIERHQPRPPKRLAPGDTLTLPDGQTIVVPDDPDEVRRLETVAALADRWNVQLYTAAPVRPTTVVARARTGGAAVSASHAFGRTGIESGRSVVLTVTTANRDYARVGI